MPLDYKLRACAEITACTILEQDLDEDEVIRDFAEFVHNQIKLLKTDRNAAAT